MKQEQAGGTRHVSHTIEQEIGEAGDEDEEQGTREEDSGSDEEGDDTVNDAFVAATEEDTVCDVSQI